MRRLASRHGRRRAAAGAPSRNPASASAPPTARQAGKGELERSSAGGLGPGGPPPSSGSGQDGTALGCDSYRCNDPVKRYGSPRELPSRNPQADVREVRQMSGRCQADVRDVRQMSGRSGRCQGDVREMSGRCQGGQADVREVREMSGRCQGDVRDVRQMSGRSGRCQADVREVRQMSGRSGRCQEDVRKMSGRCQGCQADVRQMSGRCQAEVGQRSGRGRAEVGQMSGRSGRSQGDVRGEIPARNVRPGASPPPRAPLLPREGARR